MGDYRRKGMLLLILALAFGITLVGFGLSHSYALSLAILVLVGASGTGYMTLNNTLLQSNVPPRMLGRVMSLYMLTIALMPMGALPLGALGDIIGVGTAVAGGGAITGFFILAMIFLRPSLRRLE
jgi:MFS family permease